MFANVYILHTCEREQVKEKSLDEIIAEYSSSKFLFIQSAAFSRAGTVCEIRIFFFFFFFFEPHCTKNGLTKINQDSHFVFNEFGPKGCLQLFGVADGHGPHGDKVSQYVARKLPLLLQDNEEMLLRQPQKALEKAFGVLASKLLHQADKASEQRDEARLRAIEAERMKDLDINNIPIVSEGSKGGGSQGREKKTKEKEDQSKSNGNGNDNDIDNDIDNHDDDIIAFRDELANDTHNANSEQTTMQVSSVVLREEITKIRKSNELTVPNAKSDFEPGKTPRTDYGRRKSALTFDTEFSGSTLTCGLKVGDQLYLANLGDSRTVLGRLPDEVPTRTSKIAPVQLTKDHEPVDAVEAERLRSHGANVR
ncbi:protein phosphatase, partial [Reticulomyxa filosa]